MIPSMIIAVKHTGVFKEQLKRSIQFKIMPQIFGTIIAWKAKAFLRIFRPNMDYSEKLVKSCE